MIAMTETNETEFPHLSDRSMYRFISLFAIFLGASSFYFNSFQEIVSGFWKIIASPANLITDYMELTNPGATLMNASIMTLHALLVVRLCKARINGPVLASLFLITGFSFFGKNFYNSMPIVIGALSYAKLTNNPLERSLLAALFGTALGPLVSELTFDPSYSLLTGIFIGCSAGFLAGFMLTPLAQHVIHFTKGFSLYNVGFTCGLVGTLFISVMRSFGIEVELVSIISDDYTLPFAVLLLSLFLLLFLYGFYMNGFTLKGLTDIFAHTGQLSTDNLDIGGVGATFINMSLLGAGSTFFILLLGGDLSGPVIGGIFSVVGFGAFGKNVLTSFPIMIGVTLMSYVSMLETTSPTVLIAILFSTTLSPIAGRYGTIAGIIAGAIHLTLVMNVGFLHGGVNLYNNGFAGGIVAGILVPILDAIHFHRATRLNPDAQEVNPAEEVERFDKPS